MGNYKIKTLIFLMVILLKVHFGKKQSAKAGIFGHFSHFGTILIGLLTRKLIYSEGDIYIIEAHLNAFAISLRFDFQKSLEHLIV